MPTNTFFNLSEEKKNKIIKAANKEFARVPLEQASIKNIVEDAEIARGTTIALYPRDVPVIPLVIGVTITIKIKNGTERMIFTTLPSTNCTFG